MTRTMTGLLVVTLAVLAPAEALALRTGGTGNEPLADPGWPKGAALIFNHPGRIAFWEHSGDWHSDCRGDAQALQRRPGRFCRDGREDESVSSSMTASAIAIGSQSIDSPISCRRQRSTGSLWFGRPMPGSDFVNCRQRNPTNPARPSRHRKSTSIPPTSPGATLRCRRVEVVDERWKPTVFGRRRRRDRGPGHRSGDRAADRRHGAWSTDPKRRTTISTRLLPGRRPTPKDTGC